MINQFNSKEKLNKRPKIINHKINIKIDLKV